MQRRGRSERERKRTKLGFGDNEVLLLLALALDDLVGKELLEALAHLALVDGRDVLDGLGGVGEAVDGGELEEVGSTLCRVERLVKVLGRLELGRVRDVEEAEAYGRLKEYLDHGEGCACAQRIRRRGCLVLRLVCSEMNSAL